MPQPVSQIIRWKVRKRNSCEQEEKGDCYEERVEERHGTHACGRVGGYCGRRGK